MRRERNCWKSYLRYGVRTTTTPFPIDQPAVEKAPPFARTCKGMIS